MGASHRSSIPWRRLFDLLAPVRRALAAMVALTAAGALLGLVPPLALGALINGLLESHHTTGTDWLLVLIVGAIVLEAFAFAFSDTFFARASARLYRDLRLLMFAGVQRRPEQDRGQTAGLASRFISDAEALQELLVAPFDSAVLSLFQLVSALIALGVIEPLSAVLAIGLMAITGLAMRFAQAPVAAASEARQEALEQMSASLAIELGERLDRAAARQRFRIAATRVLHRDVHVGWLEAANLYASGALANLGPIVIVAVAALRGGLKAGTLLALYLLAERAFAGSDQLVDIGLDIELVRGAVSRSFELVDD